MRLVSQDGETDINYENATLRLVRDAERRFVAIRAITNSITFKVVYDFILGKYSTEEKAYKVMEMVRNEYLNYATLRNALNSVEQICVIPRVFIFPKDEDVEV